MSSVKHPKRHPRTILNHLSFRMLYGRIVKEQQYLTSLYYNLKVIGWDDISLFPDGFAADASFLYHILKVLLKVKPKSILELGSGQSTKLTSRYIKENTKKRALILEDCEEWFEIVKPTIAISERCRFICSPLEAMKFQKHKCSWYSTKILEEEDIKYDLVIIDGPFGSYRYSRIGILNYIPKIINEKDFIIVFDDAARKGEQDTIKQAERILKKNKIPYVKFHFFGSKKQTYLTSPNYLFLGSN
ncbi:MAG: GTPase domain-containing protein [Candidatus Heimdallarchaeota archaeon]